MFPKVEIKDYKEYIDGKSIVDQPVKDSLRTYDSIQKVATGQEDDYPTDCLLVYPYFKENCK